MVPKDEERKWIRRKWDGSKHVLVFTKEGRSWSSLGRRDPPTLCVCGGGGQVGPSIRRTFGSRGSEDEVDSTCLENPGMSFPKPLDIYDTGEVG